MTGGLCLDLNASFPLIAEWWPSRKYLMIKYGGNISLLRERVSSQ